MHIQEISSKLVDNYVIEERRGNPEIKTTVDLARLDLRSEEQNIIQKIEWVHWAGERQAFVTLADGATLFFDEFAWCVNRWKVGDQVHIYKEGYWHYASGGRLADYSLYPDRDDYTVRDW
ncbi:MAG TPA: hypothetical protein VLE89_04970 [Chlamydiales bacterium]|nr:hypothetical protein [Chlamydiales bacterium]